MTTKEINKRADVKGMTLKKLANIVARGHGKGKATTVKIGQGTKILTTVSYGYRKKTTGEYVPASYLAKFGWKNTYYQPSVCCVQLDWRIAKKLEK